MLLSYLPMHGRRPWVLIILAAVSTAQAQTLASAEAYLRRGLARESRGNVTGAFADYNRALELKPSLAPAYYYRGNLLYKRGDYRAAIGDYDRSRSSAFPATHLCAYESRIHGPTLILREPHDYGAGDRFLAVGQFPHPPRAVHD